MVTRSKFHIVDPQTLGTTLKKIVAMATRRPGCMQKRYTHIFNYFGFSHWYEALRSSISGKEIGAGAFTMFYLSHDRITLSLFRGTAYDLLFFFCEILYCHSSFDVTCYLLQYSARIWLFHRSCNRIQWQLWPSQSRLKLWKTCAEMSVFTFYICQYYQISIYIHCQEHQSLRSVTPNYRMAGIKLLGMQKEGSCGII
jgi:hypothetical protein